MAGLGKIAFRALENLYKEPPKKIWGPYPHKKLPDKTVSHDTLT